MKNYRELANDIFARRDRYVAAQKKKRQRLLLMTASLGSCVLVALMGFELVNSSWFRHEPAVTDRVVHPSSATSATETTATTATTSTDGTTASTPSEGTSHSSTQGSILVVPQTTTGTASTYSTGTESKASTVPSTQESVVTHVTVSTAAPTTTGQTTLPPSTAPSSTTQTPSATATGTTTTKTTATTKATTTTRTTVTTQTTTQTNPSVTRPTTRRTTTQTTSQTIATVTTTPSKTEPSKTNSITPTTGQTNSTATQTNPTQTTVTTRTTTTQPSNEDPVEPMPEWPYLWIIYDMNANYVNGEVPIYFKLEGFEEVPFDWVKETSYTAYGFSVVGDISVERDTETGAIIYRMVLAYDGVTPKPSFFFSVVTADGMKQTDGLYGYQADHGFFVSPSYDSAFSSSVYYLVKTGVITHDEYQAIMEKYWSESVNGSMSWS